jgi:ABC-type glycerol-3-phosphate transport system permease component
MKNKLEVSPKVQNITTTGLWLIILAILVFAVINSTPSKAENLNALEVKEMPKNPALKKYHKMQRKMKFNGFKKRKGKYRL